MRIDSQANDSNILQDLLRQFSYKDEYERAGRGLPAILRAKEKVRREHLGKSFILK